MTWGPTHDPRKAAKDDIANGEDAIRAVERELNGATLTLATSAGAENRRNELRRRIEKNRQIIKKARRLLGDEGVMTPQ